MHYHPGHCLPAGICHVRRSKSSLILWGLMHRWNHSHCQLEGILQSSLLHLSRAGNLQEELINTKKTSTREKLLNCHLCIFFLIQNNIYSPENIHLFPLQNFVWAYVTEKTVVREFLQICYRGGGRTKKSREDSFIQLNRGKNLNLNWD